VPAPLPLLLQPWHLDVVWDDVQAAAVAHLALSEGRRIDGRLLDELRPISCRVGELPRCVHGSALFSRGDTQVLASATVGGL
jgi:polyribonucleotide nucleotidyltransferase